MAQKYSQKIIKAAFILFYEGDNCLTIARTLNKAYHGKISYQLVIDWTRNKAAQASDIKKQKTRTWTVISQNGLCFVTFYACCKDETAARRMWRGARHQKKHA